MSIHFGGFLGSSQRDCYGFEKPSNFDDKEYEAFISEYLPILGKRTKRWDNLVQNMNFSELKRQGYFENQKLKRFIRKGIPTSLRPKVWLLLTGVSEKMKEFPEEFSRLSSKELAEQTQAAIELDLNRTFPDNEYFQNLCGDITKKQMTAVLRALANKHPDIGYCQGLNYLSGMLLLVLKSPEPAFWLMDKILFDLPEYYTKEMRGLKTDVTVLTELIRLRAPQMTNLFKKLDFDLLLVTSKWFLCWYMETLPIETVLRIWDCLFHEGPKILFRVALTLILTNKERIMECTSFAGLVDTFKTIVSDSKTLHCHKFMENIFDIPGTLSGHSIGQLQQRYRPLCA